MVDNSPGHTWRASPFFHQQFAAIVEFGNAQREKPFVDDVQQGSDDAPLAVFADWLEERGDRREQYIRDMCNLAAAKRPLDPTLDRANTFEARIDSGSDVFYRQVGACTLVSVNADEHRMFTPSLNELLNYVVGNTPQRMVIDLAQRTYVNSRLFGYLVRIWKEIHDAGGRFCFLRIDDSLRDVFRVVRTEQLFQFSSTVDEAIDLASRIE